MKFTTEQLKALSRACDQRAEMLEVAAEKYGRPVRVVEEMKTLDELSHKFKCLLTMVEEH